MLQGQNANDVYFSKLIGHSTKKAQHNPIFTITDGSKKPSRIKGKQWDDTMVEMSVDVTEEDMKVFQSPSATPNDMQEHLAFMTAKRKR